MSKQNLGVLLALASGVFYGPVGYFGANLINSGFSTYCMLFWRFFLSAIICCITLLIKPDRAPFNHYQNLRICLNGITFYACTSIAYFLSSLLIGTGLAMVISFTHPAMVALFNIFYYKHKLHKIYFVAFLLIIVGMLCLVNMQDLNFSISGIFWALLSALSYAAYIITSQNKPEISPKIATLMTCTGATIGCLTLTLIEGNFLIPGDLSQWIDAFGIGFICTFMPILFLIQALRYINSAQAAMLSVFEPIVVVLFGVLLLGEEITYLQAVGIIITILGATLTILSDRVK
jgi:drug/metabolite transporter (DMT)-like permease